MPGIAHRLAEGIDEGIPMGPAQSAEAISIASPAPVIGHELIVVDVIQETPDSKSIVLRCPDAFRELFAYRSGQFLTFRIPSDRTGHVARSYSLSSAPGIDDDLKVTVKRTVGGYGSNWLCDNLAQGSTITVLPPSGRFTLDGDEDDLLLFAAGSGITPIMSILKTALHRSQSSVILFYANRDHASIIFRRELEEFEAAFDDRLRVVHWLDDHQGFPSFEDIATIAADNPSCATFVCGPAPFMNMVNEGIRKAGLPPERHHQEVFASLSGDPFAARPTPTGSTGPSVETVVNLAGEAHRFDWPMDRTLVDVLLDRGVDVPYSCRSGECGSCACVVVAGKVLMSESDALDPADLAEGYVLGCQSRPDAGPIEIAF
ncbi:MULTISPECIES: ferredoxin--NADP reductase [Streptomyces]|uniref:2Fe-2S iron-sulfur cluster-binding protein n=2 Tax=Streptomyces TaxID=1883 RepID=A0ABW0XXB8_9ACTN|nr:ferredoxin--NADP reductase [Streptomyces hirsutus]